MCSWILILTLLQSVLPFDLKNWTMKGSLLNQYATWWRLQDTWMSHSSCRSWIKLHFGLPSSAFLSAVNAILNISVKDCLCLTPFSSFPYSEFRDIFDVDYFIASLRDEVCILKEMPPRLKRRVEQVYLCSVPPCSSANISYYHKQVSLHLSISRDVSKSYAYPNKYCK